ALLIKDEVESVILLCMSPSDCIKFKIKKVKIKINKPHRLAHNQQFQVIHPYASHIDKAMINRIKSPTPRTHAYTQVVVAIDNVFLLIFYKNFHQLSLSLSLSLSDNK